MICDDSLCSGCGACINVCPKSCITFSCNDMGCIIPKIDSKMCIGCDLCQKVCPQLNNIKVEKPISCYASYLKNYLMRLDSSSGGVAYAFGTYILKTVKDSMVTGVCFDKKMDAVFCMTDKVSDLHQFQGSKYVQSDTKNIYTKVGKALRSDKTVLFIGMPCQVAACKQYLKILHIDDQNLITVDILCHGVAPQSYMIDEVNYLKKQRHWDEIKSISFRSNRKFRNYHLYIEAKMCNGKVVHYNRYSHEDPYFFAFLEGISLRESCYNCKFASPERVGDLTIGDFIGLSKLRSSLPFAGIANNASMILCNTDKGNVFLNDAKENLVLYERRFEEAYNSGSSLQKPFEKSKLREKFVLNYCDGAFVKTINKIAFKKLVKNRLRLGIIRAVKQVVVYLTQ